MNFIIQESKQFSHVQHRNSINMEFNILDPFSRELSTKLEPIYCNHAWIATRVFELSFCKLNGSNTQVKMLPPHLAEMQFSAKYILLFFDPSEPKRKQIKSIFDILHIISLGCLSYSM